MELPHMEGSLEVEKLISKLGNFESNNHRLLLIPIAKLNV